MTAYSRRSTSGSFDATTKTSSGSSAEAAKRPFRAGEIECPERLVDVQAPALGADDPLNGYASTVRVKPVSLLTVSHLVSRPSSIELGTAFTEPEQGTTAGKKRQSTGGEVHAQLLDGTSVRGDADLQIVGHEHAKAIG